MKITETIHQLKIPFTISLGTDKKIERFVNIYIITGKYIHLIDSGVKGSEQIIFAYIREIGREVDEIKSVFLTHAHPDHIGALKTIKETTGCQVFIHSTEKYWVEDIQKQYSERPVPGFFDLVEGSVKIDHQLENGDFLYPEDSISLKVIHTPGHSDGSVCFLYLEKNALFSGDSIITVKELPVYNNAKQCIDSLIKIQSILPIGFILSSWDNCYYQNINQKKLEDAKNYIFNIQKLFKEIVYIKKVTDEELICKYIIEKLGLPEFIINPLIKKSIMSHYSFLS